jgi:hypothetical protein
MDEASAELEAVRSAADRLISRLVSARRFEF